MQLAPPHQQFVAIGWRPIRPVPTLRPSRTDPPFETRRSKMDKNSVGRISENVLFAVLVATVIGWTAASVVDTLPASTPDALVMATTAIGNS
jgi:hypothetical protein